MNINTTALELSNYFNSIILSNIQKQESEMSQDIIEMSLKSKLKAQSDAILGSVIDMFV